MTTTVMTGNTQGTIFDCLCYLYERVQRAADFRVSLVYKTHRKLVRVGDDLELIDLSTGRAVKKRWWERKDTSQLRLPFSLYQPATIISLERVAIGTFRLRIQHEDARLAIRYVHGRGLHGSGLKAIRIHWVVPPAPPIKEVETSIPFNAAAQAPELSLLQLADALASGQTEYTHGRGWGGL